MHGSRRVFGTVFCLDAAGKHKWHTYQSGGCVVSMDIRDIDGDGKLEIGFGTGGGTYGQYMHVIDCKGERVRSYPNGYGEKYVKLGQLRKDGPFRLVRMEMRDGAVCSYQTDNQGDVERDYIKPLWEVACGGLTSAGPALADLNGDGNAEIVVASSSGNLYVTGEDANGAAAEVWRRNVQEPLSTVAAADVLSGAEPEVIAGGQLGTLYVLDSTGDTLSATDCGGTVAVIEPRPGANGKAELWVCTDRGELLRLRVK